MVLVLTRRRALAGGTVAVVQALGKPAARAADALPHLKLIERPVKASAISFVDAEGGVHTLAEYLGSGVVLNLWATWCAPCVAELPSLASLAEKLAADHVVALPLSSDHGGAAAVRQFYQTHGIENLPILLDPQGDAMRAMGVDGIPATFLIDRKGMERASVAGGEDWGSDAAVARVRQLIGG
jgi:thiol-disulfide isomerase/thioredoxin